MGRRRKPKTKPPPKSPWAVLAVVAICGIMLAGLFSQGRGVRVGGAAGAAGSGDGRRGVSGSGPSLPVTRPAYCERFEGTSTLPEDRSYAVLRTRVADLRRRIREEWVVGETSPAMGAVFRCVKLGECQAQELQRALDAPDRNTDGIDLVLSAAIAEGLRSAGAKDMALAERWVEFAGRHAAEDPDSHRLAADIARRDRRLEDRGHALARAFLLDPMSAGLAFDYAQWLSGTGRPWLALEPLDAYLETAPDDERMGRMRARLNAQKKSLEGHTRYEHQGVTLWHAPTLSAAVVTQTASEIRDALGRAAALLGRPERPALSVFVYPDRGSMVASTCGASWTGGAYAAGALQLYAGSLQRPPARRKLLDHECMHAAMASGGRGVRAPTWFTEGVAQYFAREFRPATRATYARMARSGAYMPFASIAGTFNVIDEGGDAGFAYHQSLAMVSLLAERRGETVLAEGMRWLDDGGDRDGLWEQLAQGLGGKDMLAYVKTELQRRPAGIR